MIVNLYSIRKKLENSGMPDVFEYDNVDHVLKVQFIQMLYDAFSTDNSSIVGQNLEHITKLNKILRKEYGVFSLSSGRGSVEEIKKFILDNASTDQFIDVVELYTKFIDTQLRKYNQVKRFFKLNIDEWINELNHRFMARGFGYQYVTESKKIIRNDSKFIHSEVVKPALSLLSQEKYANAADEFLSAHDHYRKELYEEALTDCNKAFETLLKIICNDNDWEFNNNDSAKKLIDIVLTNNLVPNFMQNQLNILSSLLESGVPALRNKLASHGQGTNKRNLTLTIASYAIHLTATTLLFLAESNNIVKSD